MWIKTEVICRVDLKWDSVLQQNRERVKLKCGAENKGVDQESMPETIKPWDMGLYMSNSYPSGRRQRLQLWRVWKPSPPKASLPFLLQHLTPNIDYQDSPTRWEICNVNESSQFKSGKKWLQRNRDNIGVNKTFITLQIKTSSSEKKWLLP